MAKKPTLTTDEWVRKLNELGFEMDDYCDSLHPSVWAEDPHIQKMQEQYCKLAARPTEDREQSSFCF